jgi:hypothetical protein
LGDDCLTVVGITRCWPHDLREMSWLSIFYVLSFFLYPLNSLCSLLVCFLSLSNFQNDYSGWRKFCPCFFYYLVWLFYFLIPFYVFVTFCFNFLMNYSFFTLQLNLLALRIRMLFTFYHFSVLLNFFSFFFRINSTKGLFLPQKLLHLLFYDWRVSAFLSCIFDFFTNLFYFLTFFQLVPLHLPFPASSCLLLVYFYNATSSITSPLSYLN